MNVEEHKHMQFLLAEINRFAKNWGAPNEWRRQVLSHHRFSMSGEAEVFQDRINDLQRTGAKAAFDYFEGLVSAIVQMRRDRKDRQEYHPVIEQKAKSKVYADRVLSDLFQRSRFDVNSGTAQLDPADEKTPSYRRSNDITVPISWFKSVYEKDLYAVKAPEGMRFTLSAKKRDIKFLRQDNIDAYRVVLVGTKDGIAFTEDRWLLVQEGYEKRVHSVGNDVAKAHSLLKRRVKAEILDQLLGDL